MSASKEIKNSIAKIALSLISFPVVGPLLTEALDYRGKLKQNRLNQFTELLENYFSNHSDIKLENFQTEEFSDLFESVLKRVVLTKSHEKVRMFKDILIKQIENTSQKVEESEIYLDLVSDLAEIEIKILYQYRMFVKGFQPEIDDLKDWESKLSALEKNIDISSAAHYNELVDIQTNVVHKQKELRKQQSTFTSGRFNISDDKFLFYKQRLFSKGLLIDNGVGSIGGRPFMIMGITEFGIQFIDYIMIDS